MFNKLSTSIGLKFFQTRKPLELIMFDFLYKKFFLKKKNNDFIFNYDQFGFVKIKPDISEEIDIINNNLKINDQVKKPPFDFIINHEIDKAIKDIINLRLKNYISQLEQYFNAKILPAVINLKRNTFYEKMEELDERYSDNFHNDAYTLTHFKIFINLTNVSENQGPMHIISKKKTKNFLNKINYKDRGKYNHNFFDENLIYVNSGSKYEALIFDPTQCFHRATIPERNLHRDYLTITFVGLPKKSKIKNINYFNYENNELLKFSKPKGFFNSIKNLIRYF